MVYGADQSNGLCVLDGDDGSISLQDCLYSLVTFRSCK